jgi:membrane protein DedA with SNARE-associated domain
MVVDTASISTILLTHGYWVMFLLMFLEGPIVAIVAAFAASFDVFNIFYVFVLSFFGNLVPDLLYFLIGRYSRSNLIERFVGKLGISKSKIKKIENGLKNHAKKTIVLIKVTPFISIPGIMLAGFLKLSFRRFFLISVITNLLMSVTLVLVGFYSGMATGLIVKYFHLEGYLFLILGIVGIIGYLVTKIVYSKLNRKLSK